MTFDETEAYNKPDSTEVAYYKNVVDNLRKELASLHDQLDLLRRKLDFSENTNKKFSDAHNELEKKLKQKEDEVVTWKVNFANRSADLESRLEQKEDENRELLDSMSQLIYAMNTTGLPWNTDSTAEKAYAQCRSLLKKHTG